MRSTILAATLALGLAACNTTDISPATDAALKKAAEHDARVLNGEIPGPLIGPQLVDAIAPLPSYEPPLPAYRPPVTCFGYIDPGASYAGSTCQ
jgi:hypothetical protein